jgi:hypothetical protein
MRHKGSLTPTPPKKHSKGSNFSSPKRPPLLPEQTSDSAGPHYETDVSEASESGKQQVSILCIGFACNLRTTTNQKKVYENT